MRALMQMGATVPLAKPLRATPPYVQYSLAHMSSAAAPTAPVCSYISSLHAVVGFPQQRDGPQAASQAAQLWAERLPSRSRGGICARMATAVQASAKPFPDP